VIYLDHAATTPIAPSVVEAMQPYLAAEYGNPSSLHDHGRRARAAVEQAREQVAAALGVAPLDLIFTSGGTEADNAALKGIAWAARESGQGSHLITTNIEHHAVSDALEWLVEHQGFSMDVVPVEASGVLDPERLLAAVRDDTVLVSVMAANNEIGTVQPLAEVAPALHERGIAVHTDAVQAFGRCELSFAGWGIGAAALSAHKFNGPKGVGVLYLRRDIAAQPLLHGGGQERGVRSGTFNAAGIVGCGAAAELSASTASTEIPRLRELRDGLLSELVAVGGVTHNGDAERRMPHNINVGVEGCDGEALLLAMDAAGVCVSTGSACQSGATEPSHVLSAIGAPSDRGHVRFTLGRSTTVDDTAGAATAFAGAVKRLRDAGGAFLT
jgi:cysteine desulfurase